MLFEPITNNPRCIRAYNRFSNRSLTDNTRKTSEFPMFCWKVNTMLLILQMEPSMYTPFLREKWKEVERFYPQPPLESYTRKSNDIYQRIIMMKIYDSFRKNVIGELSQKILKNPEKFEITREQYNVIKKDFEDYIWYFLEPTCSSPVLSKIKEIISAHWHTPAIKKINPLA